MRLFKFFENPFEGPTITAPRLLAAAIFHVGKLIANNVANIYDTIIADTNTKIQALQNGLNDEDVEEDESIGATKDKNTARKTLQKFISNKEGTIKGTYGKDSGTYKEFFPNGLEAFHEATDQDFITLVNGFKTKVTNHVADLGVPFETAVNNAVAAFAAAMGLHVTETGEISPVSQAVLVAQHDLAVQMHINLFTIGIHNADGPAEVIASKFFDEDLLYAEHTKKISKGEVAPHSTKPVKSIEYHASNHFNIEHKSAGAMKWRLRLNGVLVGNEFTTTIGQKLNKAFVDFAPDGDELVVINDEDIAGEYRVTEVS